MAHITINEDATRIDAVASSGQTNFNIPFEYFDSGDLAVYKNNVLLTISTDYTVTNNTTADGGFDGGTVVLGSGATTGDKVAIILNMKASRSSDFPPAGVFDIQTLNTTLDKLFVLDKVADEKLGRSLKGPSSEGALSDLPAKADRASKVMAFDGAGNATTVATDTLSLATLQAFTDWKVDAFTAGANQTAYTLSADPGQKTNTQVNINGITQEIANYSLSGTTLTLSTAPETSAKVEIRYGQAASTFVPSDNSIAYEKLLTSDIDTDLAGGVSGSHDNLASSKAIKTYVDAQVTAQDLDFQADSGGALNIDLDSESLTLAGGEGIDTVGSGNTVTISGEDASTSNKGVASFSSDNFAVSSGAVTIKAGGVDLTAEVTGTLPVANGGTGATSLTDGGVLLGSGTGAVTAMGVLGDGEIIVGDGSGDPVAESGATLRTSIGVGTGDTPTFAGLTTTGSITSTGNQITIGDNNAAGGNYDSVLHLLGDASSGFKIGVDSGNTLLTIDRELGGWQTNQLVMKRDTGNVGINVAAPSEKLAVGGNITATGNITSTGNQLKVGDNNAAGGSYDSVLWLLGDSSSGFRLSTNAANTAFNLERELGGWQGGLMMKRDTGDVAIGDTTTVSNARLTITGSDGAAGSLNYVAAIRNSDAYSTTPAAGILFQNKYNSGGSYADAGGIEVVKENATDGEYGFGLGLHTRANGAAITEKLRISGDGLVMIGGSASSYDTTPSQAGLSMYYETDSGLATIGTYSSGGATNLTFHTNTGGGANSEKVRVDSSGNVGIGTTSANQLLHLNSAAGAAINMTSGSGYLSQILFGTTAAPNHGRIQYNAGTGHMTWCTNDSSTAKMELDDAGALSITGALSKGSGSFKIDHPLPVKKDTHYLVHSFVEGPQADLIYRGRATLVDGQASVNIDDAAGMTNGTFEVLCRDIQCFTSNETGWTAVRGSVTGATLTIEAQDNSCTDTISWMVVGERKDQHMFDTGWTDDDGKVIVEPLKPVEEE